MRVRFSPGLNMKLYTHPRLSLTSVHTKDGGLYTKRWLFFRPTLSLEIDLTSHRIWQVKQEIKKSDLTKVLIGLTSKNTKIKK